MDRQQREAMLAIIEMLSDLDASDSKEVGLTVDLVICQIHEMLDEDAIGNTEAEQVVALVDPFRQLIRSKIDGLPDHPWIPGAAFIDGEIMKELDGEG